MPETALLAMALGCDMINVAREAMLAIGCIQAQRCHTGRCPVGITTHSAWRTHGLDPALKSVRLASYIYARSATNCSSSATPAESPIPARSAGLPWDRLPDASEVFAGLPRALPDDGGLRESARDACRWWAAAGRAG